MPYKEASTNYFSVSLSKCQTKKKIKNEVVHGNYLPSEQVRRKPAYMQAEHIKSIQKEILEGDVWS